MTTPDRGNEGGDDRDGAAADPGPTAPDATPVNVFRVGDRYLFRHFFDGDDVFARLKPFYESQEYRFAVPASRFDQVRAFLADRGYDLRVVDDPGAFAVACRKYRSHPGNVFKASVLQRSAGDYTVFVLRDRDSVETAVRQGASRLSEVGLELRLE